MPTDLLVLASDPTDDLGNVNRIRHLSVNGERIDREALPEMAPAAGARVLDFSPS